MQDKAKLVKVEYEEIRIDVSDPKVSKFFIRCRKVNEPAQWHAQTFPASRPVLDLVKDWQLGILRPCEWPVVPDTGGHEVLSSPVAQRPAHPAVPVELLPLRPEVSSGDRAR